MLSNSIQSLDDIVRTDIGLVGCLTEAELFNGVSALRARKPVEDEHYLFLYDEIKACRYKIAAKNLRLKIRDNSGDQPPPFKVWVKEFKAQR